MESKAGQSAKDDGKVNVGTGLDDLRADHADRLVVVQPTADVGDEVASMGSAESGGEMDARALIGEGSDELAGVSSRIDDAQGLGPLGDLLYEGGVVGWAEVRYPHALHALVKV